MRRLGGRHPRFVIAALASLVLAGSGAAAASAATGQPGIVSHIGCTNGVFAGYCGTQTDTQGFELSWAVASSAVSPGTRVLASRTGSAFFTFAFEGTTSEKVFMYAPGGVAVTSGGVNLCIAEEYGKLVLDRCTSNDDEQWDAVPAATGYEWVNDETGDIVQANGSGQQLTGVVAPGTPLNSQMWNFAPAS
jgi:hypothetical protein